MEHRCHRGKHCSDFELLDDGSKIGRKIEKPKGLCDTCHKRITRSIGSLVEDYVVLNTLLGKGSTAGGEPVRMTRDLPIPIREHIEALQRQMLMETSIWAYGVSQELHIRDFMPQHRVRPGWMMVKACRLLERSVDTLLDLADVKHGRWNYGYRSLVVRDGLDGAIELDRLHHQARQFSGKPKLVNQLPVPCPRCQEMALEREDGQEIIDCTACERHYSWDEYRQLCTLLADQREVLV